MISETAVSRRELLKRLSMAGAAALALPEFDRVLAFQREVVKATTGRGVERSRRRNPRRRLCAHHPDR